MAVQLIPSGLLLLGGFLLHESPLWLMRKGKNEQALKTLETLRKLPQNHEYIQQEVALIQNRLVEEETIASKYGSGPWALLRGAIDELSQKGIRNRVFLVFCSFTLANLSGASATQRTCLMVSPKMQIICAR